MTARPITIGIVAILCALLAGCSSGDKAERKADNQAAKPAADSTATGGGNPCEGNARLQALTNPHRVLALCAAAGAIAGADSVCVATFGQDWMTFAPRDLEERTPTEKVTSGISWLCVTIMSLPEDKGVQATDALFSWVTAYLAVQELAGIGAEAFATAVAFVPAVADLLPDNIESRAPRKEDVGATLASAEHTVLHYALARRLSEMPADQQQVTLSDLRARAAEAAKRQ